MEVNPERGSSIRSDTDAPFGKIIKVMDAAKAAGVKGVEGIHQGSWRRMSSDTPSDIPLPTACTSPQPPAGCNWATPPRRWLTWKISETHRAHFEVLHLEWHIHAQKKDWDRCVELGGYMVERHPANPAGWINQANALFYLMRGHDAFQLLNRWLSISENEAILANPASLVVKPVWRSRTRNRLVSGCRKSGGTGENSRGRADGPRHGIAFGNRSGIDRPFFRSLQPSSK